MWINRHSYDHLVALIHNLEKSIASSEGIRQTYAEQNKVLQVNADWMRVRVNQLERERAQLIFNYMGIKVDVPEVQKAPEIHATPLNEALFADMGDKEAVRQGIGWDEDGNLRYQEK